MAMEELMQGSQFSDNLKQRTILIQLKIFLLVGSLLIGIPIFGLTLGLAPAEVKEYSVASSLNTILSGAMNRFFDSEIIVTDIQTNFIDKNSWLNKRDFSSLRGVFVDMVLSFFVTWQKPKSEKEVPLPQNIEWYLLDLSTCKELGRGLVEIELTEPNSAGASERELVRAGEQLADAGVALLRGDLGGTR